MVKNRDDLGGVPEEASHDAQTEGGNAALSSPVVSYPLTFDSPAPHAKSVADVLALDESAKVEVSDWLSRQYVNAGREAVACLGRGHAFLHKTLCMLALDLVLFPDRDRRELLRARNINPASIKTTHQEGFAVAAALGVSSGTDGNKGGNGDDPNFRRYVLAAQWLIDRISAMEPAERQSITFDEAGIDTIVGLLLRAGGVNKVADLQRARSTLTSEERQLRIDLDSAAGSELLAASGRKALSEQVDESDYGDIEFQLLAVGRHKNSVVAFDREIVEEFINSKIGCLATVDRGIATLGEMMQLGGLVAEEETDRVANVNDDPSDPDSKKRLTERQYVFRPDGTAVVSALLVDEQPCPVIVVKPTTPPVTPTDGQTWKLETRGRKKLEVNIADSANRRFFTSAIVPAVGTQSEFKFVATADAAIENGPAGKDASALLQVLQSAEGNFPLDVKADTFEPGFSFSVSAYTLKTIKKELPGKGVKPTQEAVVEVTAQGGKIKFGPKKVIEFEMKVSNGTGSVRLRATHLYAVIAHAALMPATDFEFAVDKLGGVRVSFTTKQGEYAVFMPALVGGDGHASNRYFAPMVGHVPTKPAADEAVK